MTDNPLEECKFHHDIPLWPCNATTTFMGSSRFLAAKDAIFCKHPRLLTPWTRSLHLFVDPTFVDQHLKALKRLGIQERPVSRVWTEYIEQFLPDYLKAEEIQSYHDMITCLRVNDVQSSAKVAPDGKRKLCSVSSLYDHTDELFLAAFKTSQERKFVHPKFQDLKAYWVRLGLRIRNPDIASADHYLDCVQAIHTRSQDFLLDQHFDTDTQKVAGYLEYEKPSLHSWSSKHWNRIAEVAMFDVKKDFALERPYRQSRMRLLTDGSTHCSLRDAAITTQHRVLWSQLPFLRNPPAPYVYSQLPECRNPNLYTVYKHLKYLVKILDEIPNEDVSEFLKDVQACYEVLQDNIDVAKDIVAIRGERIWFNIDTMDVDTVVLEQLEGALTAADRLCINSIAEPDPFRNTLKFLSPYEKLLKALGVPALITLDIKKRERSDTMESPTADLLRNYKRMRNENKLVDVIFTAKKKSGPAKDTYEELPAHKLALAAVSTKWEKQFTGPWSQPQTGSQADGMTIRMEDISYETLNRIINFAYDGVVDWTPLDARSDLNLLANRVDDLLDLLQGSDILAIDRLHTMTQEHFHDNFNTYIRPDNVEDVREELRQARAFDVVKDCDDYIATNPNFVKAFRDRREDGGGM